MKYFTAAFILLSFTIVAQTDCKLKLEKDSIRVYTCGNESSKYKTIKVNFNLTANRAQLIAMLLDIDQLGDWQYRTVSAQLLKKISDREIIYHTEVDGPVIDNRDFVINLKIDEAPASKEWTITATSMPDYIPKKEKVVRIPMSRAVWKIKEEKRGQLAVEYIIQIDFGGVIPAWVVNSLAHKAPYETFKSMRELIGRYK
ncbi:MAG: START domain-containing protein [Cyclobacteriaceae bacterium]